MRLLRFVGESDSSIDEALMIVPDEYDKSFALEQATDYLGACHVENDVALWDETSAQTSGMSTYRVYVG